MRMCPHCGGVVTDAAIQDCPTCGLSLTQNQSAPQQSEPVPVYAAPPTQQPTSQPPYAPAYGAPANTFGAYLPDVNWQPKNQPAPRPWRRIAAGIVVALALIALVVGVFAAAQANARRVALINANATATAQTVAEHTVLTDPLTSNANGWLDNSHCYFAADGYHIVNNWYCLAPIGIQINGVESVTAEQASGSTLHSYGLVFRHQDAKNFYFFGIDSDSGWVVTKVVDGQETI